MTQCADITEAVITVKMPSVSQYMNKFNFIFAHKKITELPVPIFTKLNNSQHKVRISLIPPSSDNKWRMCRYNLIYGAKY